MITWFSRAKNAHWSILSLKLIEPVKTIKNYFVRGEFERFLLLEDNVDFVVKGIYPSQTNVV